MGSGINRKQLYRMDFQAILYSLGLTGFFSTRAFIPAFFTALFLRYGNSFPFLGDLPFVLPSGAEPTWFTSNWTILLLGVLSVAELIASKVPEFQELMNTGYRYAKSGLAFLVTAGIIQSRDAAFIEGTISQAAVFDMSLSAIVGGIVYTVSLIRDGAFQLLIDGDPDDDLGIRGLISWFEDIWSSVGIYFLIIYPLVILLLVAAFSGSLYFLKWSFQKSESKKKLICSNCGAEMYGSALYCPACKAENPKPKTLGFLGQTIEKPIQSIPLHRVKLLSYRRCVSCAAPQKIRTLPHTCPDCQTPVFQSDEIVSLYLNTISSRLPKVLIVCALFGLIPAIGIIPGIIYYRISIVAPFKTYIPSMKGLAVKIGLKLLFLLLITVQLIPFVGAISVPIMALLSFLTYRSVFKNIISNSQKQYAS